MSPVWQALSRFDPGTLWSVTDFPNPKLTAYAERLMLPEVRRGLTHMAGLSLLLNLLATLLYAELGHGLAYIYTYGLMFLLALHVLISARRATRLGDLYALGITLLVVTSAALVLLAHRLSSVEGPLLVSVVLLFMSIPLVPWGLKQCSTAIVLVYGVFTLSTYGVAERFTAENLMTMQFLLLASALATVSIAARNVAVRRDDIEARFKLERAYSKLHRISHRDPLTGAWNRRFLEKNFARIVARARNQNADVYLALFDIDKFKTVNDRHGHQYGDNVLKRFSSVLRERIGKGGFVVRLGGDEFALLFWGDDLDSRLAEAFARLNSTDDPTNGLTEPIYASVGMVRLTGEDVQFETLYRNADRALYEQKRRRGSERAVSAPTRVLGGAA